MINVNCKTEHGQSHYVPGASTPGLFLVSCIASILLLASTLAFADEIELTDGRKYTGLIVAQDTSRVVFRVVYPSGGKVEMTFSIDRVKSVKKSPLPEPTTKPQPPNLAPPKPAELSQDDFDDDFATDLPLPTTQPAQAAQRDQIDALIDKAGKEQPAWWDSVQLNFPPTMDLAWPEPPPPGPWNPNKHVNQYLISVINPNPARHQEGAKFMHHVLTVNKDNKRAQARTMLKLGYMYGICLRDWPRGAFWYRKAAKIAALNATDTANLAYYYWKMGSREMALTEMARASQYDTQTIRVLASIGELVKAIDLAKRMAPSYPEGAYLAGGDALRLNHNYKEAAQWYQQILSLQPQDPRAINRLKLYKARAAANIEAVAFFDKINLRNIPDGTFSNESIGYRDPPVRVDVIVKSGQIQDIKIVQTKEDWPLNALVVVPQDIIQKQSVEGIDTVSGATVTSEAVLNATAKALGTAKPNP